MKDLGPLLLAWGASLAVLFLERDMGASLLFFGVFVVMVWVASGRPGVPRRSGLVLFAAGAYFGYLAFGHVQVRVDYWLHALDPTKVHGHRLLPARPGVVRDGDAAASSAPDSARARRR